MMKLEDWLDDLCVRFIINLPKSELESVERICFQVEEAQWFYEDFIRPLDPSLPSLNLRAFSLKIFQHCSFFSQWSPEHHMSAFAEFLAYKQRVPVRGAIMLNQDMDQVVLVKGWKKGANWSFPRGKINKDENDLDCAVREVYEETGFDIKEAGLVKEEKEMKHIEVTMREQHMRLYVFRGVPMTTHFEPRTRKEISKIEWYRLTELPTLKKHKHQDSNGQPQVVNANKFYMVAPFLNPLKKWISQQRKNDSRQCLPHLAPLNFLEEISQDEDETLRPHLHQVPSHGPSNLPEVAYTQSEAQDPSADLKRLLNININGPQQMATPHPIKAPPPNNLAKSSALLALLRSGSTAEMRDGPLTPRDQISFAPGAPRSPHRPQAYEPPFPSMSSAPQFQISPAPAHGGASQSRMQPVEIIQRQDLSPRSRWQAKLPSHSTSTEQPSQLSPMVSLQRFAPYQNTGDPQFSRPKADSSRMSGVPPASALPKLTNHTKSLLDAFKLAPSVPGSAPNSAPSARGLLGATPQISSLPSTHSQSLLEIFKTTPSPVMGSTQAETTDRLSGRDRRQNLMDLFQHPSTNLAAQMQPGETIKIASQPAELAANVVNMATPKLNTDQGQSKTKKQNKHAAPREGETTATVSGPLNQPQFEGIIKSTRKATNGGRRSPVPANKTLYDHKNPTPVKILTRPEDSRGSPGRSPPRLSNVRPSGSSPRRGVVSKEGKEPPKVFQPQILRRPQTPSSSALQARKESANEIAAPSSVSDQAEVPIFRKNPLQAESHRQALLSLFNNPLQIAQTSTAPQDPISGVSNVTTSQAGSPITDGQTQPISTRSRVGSLASIGGRPRIEKRQTAAGDKAFLLGYLGRIANQEGSQ